MRKAILLFLAGIGFLLFACGEQNNSIGQAFGTGGYTFNLKFPDDVTASTDKRSSLALDCAASGVSEVRVIIFDTSNNQLAMNTFPCTNHSGQVENIPAGSGYRADFHGIDGSGKSIYYGQDKSGITITAGVVTNGSEVLMDYVGPVVLSTYPARNATGVAIDDSIAANFSKAMNSASITNSSFVLTQGLNNIPGNATYNSQTATFKSSSPLAYNTTYTATVKGTVTDTDGYALRSDYSWSFTTVDTAPTIQSVSPSESADGVALNANISVTFSELMDNSTINNSTFLLRNSSTAVTGEITYSGRTATFNPTSDLASGTIYTAIVKGTVRDSAGIAMGQDRSWTFTTVCNRTTYTNSLGMTFRYICSGTFYMGSPDTEAGRNTDETLHQVTLTNGFFMQATEVTQDQWTSLMGSNPSHFSNCGNCPVEMVSWDMVQTYINAMNQRGEGTYRLPTEAEWEYCARAGMTTPFNTGNCLSTDQANYDGSYPYTGCSLGVYRGTPIAVGSFTSNAWGLCDMHGNVWEWCSDWNGSYPATAVTNPTGAASGNYRVLRGGGWGSNAGGCRSAIRVYGTPDSSGNILGFRLVRTENRPN